MKTSIKITIATVLTAANIAASSLGAITVYLHHVQTSVEASCQHIDNNIRYGYRIAGDLPESIKKINSEEMEKMNNIYNSSPIFLRSKVDDIINTTMTKYIYAD